MYKYYSSFLSFIFPLKHLFLLNTLKYNLSSLYFEMAAETNAVKILLLKMISSLQDPIPQYVLVCLPAIATVGAAPDNGLMRKLLWIFRTLGCPFSGLFYFCNINEKRMCTYWLTSESFVKVENKNRKNTGNRESSILYRPFGYHAMELDLTQSQEEYVKECIAEATVLDRLSSIASAYYILFGIFVGIAKVTGAIENSCSTKDWPYIPAALAWTFPVICVRLFNGKVVFKDPRQIFQYGEKKEEDEWDEDNEVSEVIKEDEEKGVDQDNKIRVKNLKEDILNSKRAHTMLTAVFSVSIPWVAVLLAYFTKPIGFLCRSKFLTCENLFFFYITIYLIHFITFLTI